MKRTVVLVLVVGLLLGLLLSTGVSAKGPGQPQSTQAQGPILLTIAEGQTLAPGEVFRSEWRDVKSFRLFKFYAHLTPYEGVTDKDVNVRVLESPLGDPDEGSYCGVAGVDAYVWRALPPAPAVPNRWVMTLNFTGLYSKMMVFARNDCGEEVTLSLYLLMARE